MEQRTERAYRLTWEMDYLELCDQKDELELEEFPGSDWMARLMEITPYELPDPVIFWGNPEFLTYVDYPTNNVNWPIMSRRMYYTLLTVGDFPHRVIPIAMMDGGRFFSEPERRFLADGQPNPEITNLNDLVAIQLLEESDYFDFERSEYEPSPIIPYRVGSVDKYVLNEAPKGFPPLFRLAVQSSELFISAKAREALKEASIRGITYIFSDGFRTVKSPEVDIPVQIPTYP
jgi:hypothetical protein